MYSFEDKCFIEQYVTRHSLDVFSTENEEKWQELGSIMNRNWEDIRKMYENWKIQKASELENNGQSEDQSLHFIVESDLLPEDGLDTIDFVNINGRLVRTDEVQHLLDGQLLQPINIQINSSIQSSLSGQTSLAVPSSSEKRPREESEVNLDIVKIFKRQTDEELDLKRQEHKEKMMFYKQMLIQGEELHQEKMKILKAKLRAIEEKVGIIDNVICNRNLTKKFKSGPI